MYGHANCHGNHHHWFYYREPNNSFGNSMRKCKSCGVVEKHSMLGWITEVSPSQALGKKLAEEFFKPFKEGNDA